MARISGVVLLGVSFVSLLVGVLWLVVSVGKGATENLSTDGAVLGFALLVVCIAMPIAVGGVLMIFKGREEATDDAYADDLRQILDMVKTRREVTLEDLIIELNRERSTVQEMVYALVGMGLFDGYVNWDEGKLYSESLQTIHDLRNCRNCNGEIVIAGKGVFKCPYCGVEYFTSS